MAQPTQPKRSDGKSVDVVAAAARTKGLPVLEEGFVGFPQTDAAIGETYALNIAQEEFEVEVGAGVVAAKGDVLWITAGHVVDDTAAAGANRPFLRVTVAKDANNIVWGILLPQIAVI